MGRGGGGRGTDIKCDSRILHKYNSDFWILLVCTWLHDGQIPWWTTRAFLSAGNKLVCYTAVFSVITQQSSPQTSVENWTTFLSLCVCVLFWGRNQSFMRNLTICELQGARMQTLFSIIDERFPKTIHRNVVRTSMSCITFAQLACCCCLSHKFWIGLWEHYFS